MKRTVLIQIFFLLPFVVASAQHSIEGVWSLVQNPSMGGAAEHEFSWGRRIFSRNFQFMVDLHSDPPALTQFAMLPNRIVSVYEKGTITKLTLRTDDYMDVTLTFHFNENGTMWMEQPYAAFFGLIPTPTNEPRIHYKIEGPEFDLAAEAQRRSLAFQRTHTITGDLPLWEKDGMGREIKTLPKGSDIQLLELDKWVETIQGITGKFAYIVTVDGTVGWLFSDMFIPPEDFVAEVATTNENSVIIEEITVTTGNGSRRIGLGFFFLLMPLFAIILFLPRKNKT